MPSGIVPCAVWQGARLASAALGPRAALSRATPALCHDARHPALSLEELVREAAERNPEVQMARRTVEARRARIPQAGALPDPMLTYGVINEGRPIPFDTLGERDFSEVYVGVSQELPY